MLLSTRRCHGSLPVRVVPEGYELLRETGVVERHRNAHSLLLSLYGGKFAGMSFDRYFHLGRYAYRVPERPKLQLVLRPKLLLPVSCGVPGITLDTKEHLREVARLLQASCGKLIRSNGYDFEDVFQEVCRGLLVRNQGQGAWDPSKSSFGTYVTMVSRCVFSNYHRQAQRLKSREVVGLKVYTSDGEVDVDASEVAISDTPNDRELYECLEDLTDQLTSKTIPSGDVLVAKEALPLVFAGRRRSEIAELLSVPSPTVGRALAYLRQMAGVWVQK